MHPFPLPPKPDRSGLQRAALPASLPLLGLPAYSDVTDEAPRGPDVDGDALAADADRFTIHLKGAYNGR
jgi:hypothetical protein